MILSKMAVGIFFKAILLKELIYTEFLIIPSPEATSLMHIIYQLFYARKVNQNPKSIETNRLLLLLV